MNELKKKKLFVLYEECSWLMLRRAALGFLLAASRTFNDKLPSSASVAGSTAAKEGSGKNFTDHRPRNPNEDTELLRKRLGFQSRYRGMVEMDLICGGFANVHLPTLTRDELQQYDEILRQLDYELFHWLLEGYPVPPEILKLPVWEKLVKFVADNKEDMEKVLQ